MNVRKMLLILTAALLLLLLAGCGDSNTPPDPGTPAPPPLNGVYRSAEGTMIFNGDGETIRLEGISEVLADAAGLPMGSSEGSYVFLRRNEHWRYDMAESLQITIGEKTAVLTNVAGETGEGVVAVVSPLGKGKFLRFLRQDD